MYNGQTGGLTLSASTENPKLLSNTHLGLEEISTIFVPRFPVIAPGC